MIVGGIGYKIGLCGLGTYDDLDKNFIGVDE